jgi:hypothetical protein
MKDAMKKILNNKQVLIPILVVSAVAIAFLSALFPAGIVFNGYYRGISYHGFPAAWMGATRGAGSLIDNADSLGSIGYLLGFVFDVLFWFCIAFLIYFIQQEGKR